MSGRRYFEPGMATPNKTPSKGKGRSTRPYAATCVTALKMGIGISDLRQMSLTTVLNLVGAYAELSAPEGEEGGTREATQQDIDALLS